VLNEITRPDPRIDDDLRALDNGTARLLTPEDRDWPLGRLTALAGLGAPLALWVRGRGSMAKLTNLAVTVTGARASTERGNTVAGDVSCELARAGVTVLSGGSLGVDEAAHRGALAADGRTIVVLANGVDRTHPHQHTQLYREVIEQGGLLVSEYPIGTRPTRIRFLIRTNALTSCMLRVGSGGVASLGRSWSDRCPRRCSRRSRRGRRVGWREGWSRWRGRSPR
jgi:DNA processing protein